MKKLLFFSIITLGVTCAAFAQTVVSLDESIIQAQRDIDGKLEKGTKIVVLNVTSPSTRFSDYVLEELTARLVNSGALLVVDRQNLALIQQEMDFQMSGEVSDESAQEIGMKLGAESIVSGSLSEAGGQYRLRFRTISVETAAIQVLTNTTVQNDRQMSGLFTSESNIGLTWTNSEKWVKGAMNMAFGAGSFTMKDWVGGGIIAGAELTGVILLIYGITTAGETSSGSRGGGDYSYSETSETATLLMVGGGLALTVGSIIFGYVRPFSYDKALAKKNGLAFSPSNMNVGLVPMKDDSLGLNVSYTFSF